MLASSSFREDCFATLSNNYCMHQSLLLGDTYFAFMYGILYVCYRRDQSAVIVTFVFSEMVTVRFPEHMSRRRGRSGSRVCPLSVVFLPAPGRRCLVSGSGDESGPRAACASSRRRIGFRVQESRRTGSVLRLATTTRGRVPRTLECVAVLPADRDRSGGRTSDALGTFCVSVLFSVPSLE